MPLQVAPNTSRGQVIELWWISQITLSSVVRCQQRVERPAVGALSLPFQDGDVQVLQQKAARQATRHHAQLGEQECNLCVT